MKPLLALLACLALTTALPAQTPPTTTLVTPTQQIVFTAFDEDTPLIRKKPIHGWQAAIGQWQV
ncbi:MAG: hypothetical protein Q8S53_10190, partial [Brevundimonas sp.]|uniref:hypothetical protein n=1 Tax=Brevundimonas sp. TaxID=1871086 RepID=UPI002734F5CC